MPDNPPVVHQMRVVLAGISPLVWRRLLVPAEISIADLHTVMQTAFGWSDQHLRRFTVHGVKYGLWQPGSAGFSHDAHQVQLSRFGLRVGERFTYGTTSSPDGATISGWRRSCPARPARRYPVRTGGARRAPSEDCAGPEAFLALRQR